VTRLQTVGVSMAEKTPMFPILGDQIIKALPWSMMAPHEAQAQRNHSQSLSRLASRGGLGIDEAWYVLKDCPYNFRVKLNKDHIRIMLMRLVKEHNATDASHDAAANCGGL